MSLASERRKLGRAVAAVRAALRAELQETLKEGFQVVLVDRELRRPDHTDAVQQRRGRPYWNEAPIPRTRLRRASGEPNRTSFYKHLNQELADRKRGGVRDRNSV